MAQHPLKLQDYEGRRKALPFPVDRRRTAMWDHCPLTQRQLEVIQLTAEGLTYEQIAHELGVGLRGIHRHLDTAREKLSIGGKMNRAQIVAIAMREGWID